MKAPDKGPAVVLMKPAEILNYQVRSKAHVLQAFVRFSGFAFRVFIVVWSWHPDAGVKFAEEIPLMTVTTKPGHRGERGGNRKTIARGMPGDPA
jgi:hypothetical protein